MSMVAQRTVGMVIKEQRLRKGMTQLQLAEHASLNLKTIYSVESNLHEPRLRTLRALANALELEFMELMRMVNQQLTAYG